jgi:hypothetical protein
MWVGGCGDGAGAVMMVDAWDRCCFRSFHATTIKLDVEWSGVEWSQLRVALGTGGSCWMGTERHGFGKDPIRPNQPTKEGTMMLPVKFGV